jgi:hypothetical protein
MTVLVAIGVIMEGPEIVHEARDAWFQCRGRRVTSRRIAPWITLVGALGWLLIAIGVAGEGYWEVQVSHDDEAITSFDEQKLGDAEKSAATATALAAELGVKVDELPSFVAEKERELAGNVTQFQQYARSVEGQTGNDLRRLKEGTAALNKARDEATTAAKQAEDERAAVEAEMNRLKTPRSIVNSDSLIAALRPFSGTEYVLQVFLDQESTEFIKSVARELDAAGWVRKQPAGMNIGHPTMRIDFGKGLEYVSSCIETGVNVHVFSQVPVETLQTTPAFNLPTEFGAANTVRTAFRVDIEPPDESNAGKVIEVDADKNVIGADGQVGICVGKKP